MTTLTNGKMVPAWLIIDSTRTKDVNEKDEERQEAEYYIQHKSSADTFRLLTDAERKRNRDDE